MWTASFASDRASLGRTCALASALGLALTLPLAACSSDPCSPNPCSDAHKGVCEAQDGEAVCTCDPGAKPDGDRCYVDYCGDANGGCDALSSCTNGDDGPVCGACPSGYSGTGDTACIDVDECAQSSTTCPALHGGCRNLPGDYECFCDPGYVITVSGEYCASRLDTIGAEYTGNVLVASNEASDGNAFQPSGALPTAIDTLPEPRARATGDAASRRLWRVNPILPLPEGLTSDDVVQPRPERVLRQALQVGDTHQYLTVNFTNGSAESLLFTLRAIGDHCNVWAADSKVTTQKATLMAQEFDDVIYDLVATNFHAPSNVNGDGRANLLLFDIKDGFETSGSYTGGYFDPEDMFETAASNRGEFLYIDTYPSMHYPESNPLNIAGAYATVVHEFQHLTNFNRNVIVESGGNASYASAAAYQQATWINEGLSMAAEHLYSGTLEDRIDYFNESESIREGHSLLYWAYSGDVLANYSLSYLFFQYLRIQVGGDATVYKDVLSDYDNDARAVAHVIAARLDPGLTLGAFMTRFRVALLLREASGPYGFNGEEGFDAITPRYAVATSADLRGGGAVYKRMSQPFHRPSNAGAKMAFVGVTTGATTTYDPSTDPCFVNPCTTAPRTLCTVESDAAVCLCDGGLVDVNGSCVAPAFVSVSVGVDHACAVRNDGALFCWGRNTVGQIGNDATTTTETLPARVAPDKKWSAVAAGNTFTCGIAAGELYCWGNNTSKALGGSTEAFVRKPVKVTTPFTDFTQLDVGSTHACALRSGGRLYCWGANGVGQLGDGSIAVRTGAVEVAGGFTDWTSVAVGNDSACALRAGRMYCWGDLVLQTGSLSSHAPVETLGSYTDWSQVTVGLGHVCGIRAGQSLCWGFNLDGELGDGTSDSSYDALVQVSGGFSDWASVASSFASTCGLRAGHALCWGDNSKLTLGVIGTADRLSPVEVTGTFSDWQVLSVGNWNSCGLRGGAVYCWGDVTALGSEATAATAVPTLVSPSL